VIGHQWWWEFRYPDLGITTANELHLPAGLPIWVDRRVMGRPEIILGGGSRSWKVKAPPAILLALPGVEVVDDLAFEPPSA